MASHKKCNILLRFTILKKMNFLFQIFDLARGVPKLTKQLEIHRIQTSNLIFSKTNSYADVKICWAVSFPVKKLT